MNNSPPSLTIQDTSPQSLAIQVLNEVTTYLQDRVWPVAAVLLDAEDEIPGPVAAHRLHEPSARARTTPSLAKQGQERREGKEGGARNVQEVVVSAEGEEVVDALDEGALEDGPLPAQERHHHQRRHRPVRHQQPRHLHPVAGSSPRPRRLTAAGDSDRSRQSQRNRRRTGETTRSNLF